jgi:hypothetical protein
MVRKVEGSSSRKAAVMGWQVKCTTYVVRYPREGGKRLEQQHALFTPVVVAGAHDWAHEGAANSKSLFQQ